MNYKHYTIHTVLTEFKWVADFRQVVAETKSWLLEKLFGDVYVGYKVLHIQPYCDHLVAQSPNLSFC